MKTIEDIKNEVAREHGYANSMDVFEFAYALCDEVAKRYATEAIKADRERIKNKFDDCEYADHVIYGINNLPIELK